MIKKNAKYKDKRICKTCGKEFSGSVAYCTLECLHKSNKAQGSYYEKRKILDFMLENPRTSMRKTAEIFGVNRSVVEALRHYTNNPRIFVETNDNFFNSIDTENKAYWLGFLYADGYVKRTNNTYRIEIGLSNVDVNHLEKFKRDIETTAKIESKISKAGGKEYPANRISIFSQQIYNDLVRCGCVENKSLKLTFPPYDIFKNEDLIRHFIRGYVDGDGCVALYEYSDRKPSSLLTILGTRKFLYGLKNFLEKQGIISELDNIYKHKNVFELRKVSRKANEILNFIYSDCSVYLDRKYEKYIKICNHYKMYSNLSGDTKQS